LPFVPFIIGALGVFWGTVATIAIGIGVTAGLGFISRLLAPKPPTSGPLGRDLTINQPDAAWQIVYGEMVVGGSLFAIELLGTNNEFLELGIVWCYGGPDGIESIDQIWFGDEVAVNGTTPISKYTGLITVEHKLGTDAQTASTILTGDLPARFSATDKGSGFAYSVLKLKQNDQKFSDFSIEGIRAKIKGRKVLDPRTGSVAWTQNPVLCIRDYLSNTRFGLGYGQAGRSLPVILDDAFNNGQANICDELVNKKAGGTRPRYAMNMAFTTAAEPGRAVQEMFTAMGGGPSYTNGKWRLLAGAWRPPMVVLDDDDLRGPVQITMSLGRLETFNGVRGTFLDPTHWQPTSYPFYAPPDVLAEDDGIRIWKDLDFAAVTEAGQAQQIAKLALEIIRRPKRLVLPCKFLAYELLPGDTFRFTHDDWVEKTFAVEQLVMAVEHDERGGVILGVDVHAREEDPGVYYWNPSVDEGVYTTPPAGNFPPPGDGLVSGAGNRSYRPRSNPLTATDAGSNTTISVASFTMEVGGIATAPVPNSGSITALSFDTLYFVAYKDPALLGGAVTYEAFATKEDALKEGRFFVGSITTPRDGGGDTKGYNDGGVGAQAGKLYALRPGSSTQNTASTGSVANRENARDGDDTSFATLTAPGSGTAALASMDLLDFPGIVEPLKSLTLKIRSEVPTFSTNGPDHLAALQYSTDDGASWTDIFNITTTRSVSLDSVVLSVATNSSRVRVRMTVDEGSSTSGSIIGRLHEAWLEAQA